jgi:hypothetical protein
VTCRPDSPGEGVVAQAARRSAAAHGMNSRIAWIFIIGFRSFENKLQHRPMEWTHLSIRFYRKEKLSFV